mmetsp:Transcript_43371/g.117522  ORF Transcript_43371/g.117522 Transcript_43371/m.117522 type:complete len:124 (-) Transcript_43371:39-410(-)
MPSTISLVDQIIVGYFEASPCAEERDAKRGLPRDLEVEQLSRRLRSKHAAQERELRETRYKVEQEQLELSRREGELASKLWVHVLQEGESRRAYSRQADAVVDLKRELGRSRYSSATAAAAAT